MFGPKLDSKSYTTFLLIVIGVLLSLNLFAQMSVPDRDTTIDSRYDMTLGQRDIAASNQAVAASTDRVAAANQAIAQSLQAIANAIEGRSSFDVNVTMADEGSAAVPGQPVASDPEAETVVEERGRFQLRTPE